MVLFQVTGCKFQVELELAALVADRKFFVCSVGFVVKPSGV